ncbi:alpha/beta hydrolase [Nocardia rhamnosiphila]|uniref:alpha/beta hydrolase n=1 Tax=Nocardia rhamnosiphila TaxID=426716 RepID=UPI0033FE1353
MDPEFVDVLAHFPALQFEDPAAQRRAFQSAAESTEKTRWRSDVRLELGRTARSRDGWDVPLRAYVPAGLHADAGTLVWIHGGGYVVGSADEDDRLCAHLAAEAGIAVVSVDYRLAPEHPYPAGFEDCYAAVRALGPGTGRSTEFADFDDGPLLVGGASAGAGLAAAVTLRLRDEGSDTVSGQLLLCPFLDSTLSTHSITTLADSPVFNAHDAEVCWQHYLGDDRKAPPPYGSPFAAGDLSGLPPAYIAAAGLDCLHDEALQYAVRMQRAGVDVEFHTFPGVPHGYTGVAPRTRASRRTIRDMVDVLHAMTGSPPRQRQPVAVGREEGPE